MSPDRAVFSWVQSRLQIPLLQYVCRDLTSCGGNFWIPSITILVACILGLAGDWRTAGAIGLAVAFTGLLIYVFKVAIGRPCPLQPDPYQHRLVTYRQITGTTRTCQCDFGGFPTPHLPCFPSGHTCASTFLYGMLACMTASRWPELRPLWPCIGIGLPVAVGATRIVLSAHWTSDVIGGWALGNLLLGGWRLWLS